MKNKTPKLRAFLETLPQGFSYHKVITDERGTPVDFIFLEVNPSFEKITGLSAEDVLNRPVTEVFPGIEKEEDKFIINAGRVGLGGGSSVLERYFPHLDKWFELSISSAEKGFFGVLFRDITRTKKTEKSFRESREKYREVLSTLDEGIIIQDSSGRVLECNDTAEKILGLSKTEIFQSEGKIFGERLVNKDGEKLDFLDSDGETGQQKNRVIGFKKDNGEIAWLNLKKKNLNSGGQEKSLDIISFSEITQQIALEEKQKRNEEKYRALVNQSVDMLFVHDFEGNILEVNQETVKRTGFSREKLLQMKVFDLHINPDDGDWIIQEWKNWKVGNGPVTIEDYHVHADGSVVPVEIATGKVAYGGQEYILALVRDISERKQMEAALRSSEENLKTTLNSIGDAVIATDLEGLIVRMNPVAEKLTGWPEEGARGVPLADVFKIVNSRTGAPVKNPVQEVLSSGKTVGLANHTMLIGKDGQKYQIADSASPILNQEGEITGVVLVFRDITGEYQIQERLKKSEERHNLAMTAANDGIWDWNIAEGKVYFDPRYFTMAGYEPDEFPHTPASWEERVHPDDIDGAKEAIRAHLSGETSELKTEFRFKCRDGSWMWILGRGKILGRDENGNPERMVGIHSEITNRKRAEEELKTQKERLGSFLEGTDVGTWEWNVQTGENIFNEKWAEIIGYTLEELHPTSLETWRELVHPEDLPASETMLEKHLNGEVDLYDMEYRMQHKDGCWVWVQDRGKVISWTEDGKPLWFFGTHLDISERKETERALRESEERLQLMTRNYHDVVVELDSEGICRYISPSFKKVLGRGNEVIGYNLFEFIHPEDLKRVIDVFQNSIKTGEEARIELRYRHPEKGYIWLESIGSTYKNRNNETVLLTTTRDISHRKKIEQDLLQSKNLIEGIFNSIQDGISVLNPDLSIRKVNKAMEKWYDKNLPLQGKKCYEAYQNRSEPCQPCPSLKAMETGVMQVEAVKLPDNIEGIEWIESYSYPFIDPEGNAIGVVEFIRDITDRKKAEQEIKNTKLKVERLHEKTLQINLAEKEEQVHKLIIGAAEEILNFRLCTVDIVENNFFVVKATSKAMPEGGSRNMAVTEGIAGKSFAKGKTILINDLWEAEGGRPIKRSYRALLSTPIGQLGIFQAVSTRKNFFTQEDVNLAEILINHAAEAIKRIRSEKNIRYMSFHDSLTGLYNRTFLEHEIKRMDTGMHNPISIIMGDINGLKLVNDAYGHNDGDELLKSAAQILKKICRNEDIIGRWGGDEFVILLPKTSLLEANAICYRIINESKGVSIKTIPLSMALGVASKENIDDDIFATLALAEKRMYRNKLSESRSARSAVLTSLIKTLEEKSQETEEHTLRMGELAKKMARKIGLLQEEMNRLNILVSLHDIGKIVIPEYILNKPGKLNEEEWRMVKTHPETGYRIARSTDEISHVAEEILSHHERWDGKGYPRGLAGEDIPLLARINAIVDAFDVMTNGRPYKKPISRQEAIAELKRCAGEQFDPELVRIFIEILE